MIEVRRLKQEDYEDILDISKDIWDGTDYLPKLFNKWVEDKGAFIGLIHKEKNKVVAVAKYTILSDGSGWLEGLRAHKDYKGQGLGKRVVEEVFKIAKEDLERGKINKIAMATYFSSVESINIFKGLNFKLMDSQYLIIKEIDAVEKNVKLKDFNFTPWNPTYEELINNNYFLKRKNILPLAFLFEELTIELYNKLIKENAFVLINGYAGIFKYKGEPNFVVMEESFEAINTFMNYYLLSYREAGVKEIYTPVIGDLELLDGLKDNGYISWSDWKKDYLYFVYSEI